MTTLGRLIRQRRLQLGMKQDSLAAAVDTAQSYISDIERGKQVNITAGLLERLAGALNLPFEDVVRAAAQGGDLPPVATLRAEGVSEPVLDHLAQIWAQLTEEDREAVVAMVRALAARYEPAPPQEHGTGHPPHYVEGKAPA